MDKLKVIFKRIREDFKAYVPPLTETVDQEHHYEVWYITDKEKLFFGSIVLHQDYAEITFLSDIS